MTAEWTRPYYGLSYLGELSDERRVTLQIFDSPRLYQITFWQRGCGYGQRQEMFTSERKAKDAGEAWCGVGKTCPTCGR